MTREEGISSQTLSYRGLIDTNVAEASDRHVVVFRLSVSLRDPYPYAATSSVLDGYLATAGDLTIAAVARLLALPEEFLVRHDRLVRMRIFHVVDISTVFGHANHEPHALSQVPNRSAYFI